MRHSFYFSRERGSYSLMARRNPYANIKRGRAPDLGDTYFRSSWERNYARILKLLKATGIIEDWAYEPQKFLFTDFGYKRGPWVYTPDFAVLVNGVTEFREIKGRETGSDRSKWSRFRKHTQYELKVIGKKEYRLLEATYAPRIPEWEFNFAFSEKRSA